MNNFTENTFIDRFFTRVNDTSKVNKNQFNKRTLEKYLRTIEVLNATQGHVSMLAGEVVTDYEVPSFLQDLIIPRVTISAQYGEKPLIEFKPLGKDETVMSAFEFNSFSRIFNVIYRVREDLVKVRTILNQDAKIGDYANRLTDLSGDFVSINFETGEYPLVPNCEFFIDEGLAMAAERAKYIWIDKKFDALANQQ